MKLPEKRVRHLFECCDGRRIPLNAEQRSERPGPVPYWGANSIVGFVNQALFDEELVLLGEDGAPFFERDRSKAFRVTGPTWPNNHIHVLRPLNGVNARFMAYALNSIDYSPYVDGSTRDKLTQAAMNDIALPSPKSDVQESIANFLDEQTARIDALIAEKSLLAEKVRDYVKAELTRLAVTGLLGAPAEVTGNQLVPQAPRGWRVAAFKRAIHGMEQGWSPQCESRPADSNEWGVLKVGCVNGPRFDPLENKALPPELEPDMRCVLRKGDVLVSRANTRELVGSAALVWGDFPNLLLCDKLYRLRIRTEWLLPEYAVLVLRSESARRQIELGASGASSSMQNISQDVLRELVVAVPPLSEQVEILQRAKAVQMNCEDLVAHIDQHIDRLREYRSSLISAAVTGQIDVGAFKEAA